MNKIQTSAFEARAKVLRAMGQATRLYIVHELANGERCVCDLQEMIGADMSTVSKHLSVLREAGIVVGERKGNQVFYSLRCPCVLQFFNCVEKVIRDSAEQSLAP